MPAKHIYKPNQTSAGFLLAEKIGLVCKYAGKAFNKMIFQPPFNSCSHTYPAYGIFDFPALKPYPWVGSALFFFLKLLNKFTLAPMGVLAPGSEQARPSAQPPINTSRIFVGAHGLVGGSKIVGPQILLTPIKC
jgi:hypothetical protein